MRRVIPIVTATVAFASVAAPAFAVSAPPPTDPAPVVGDPRPVRTDGPVSRKARAPLPVQVTIDRITPDAPNENSKITIRGVIKNTGAAGLNAIQVRLRYSRSPLSEYRLLTLYSQGAYAIDQPLYAPAIRVSQLPPQGDLPYTLDVTARQLGLSGFGVYPLGVEVVDANGTQVGAQRTFLPFMRKDARIKPTKLAWLLPMVDRPHRADDVTFTDDDLRTSLTRDGRLGELVEGAERAVKPETLTWIVDTGLLDDAQNMTKEYGVVPSGDVKRRLAPAAPVATDWLDRLRTVTAKSTVIGTPYADPDLAALTHHSLSDEVKVAIETGREVGRQVLSPAVNSTVVWPVDGALDLDTLDNLVVNGVRTVILADFVLQPDPAIGSTPDAWAQINSVQGPITALVADSGLTLALSADTRTASGATLAKQRFLAETALITAERPNDPRTIVAAPPRRWDPGATFLADVLNATAAVPWLERVPITKVAKPKAPLTRDGPRYTAENIRGELSKAYMTAVRDTYAKSQATGAIRVDPVNQFKPAILRTASSAWRDRTLVDRAKRTRGMVASAVENRIKKVRIINKGGPAPTLAGDEGPVPITITNDLDTTVNVRLSISSSNETRLTIGSYQTDWTIKPHQKQTISVPMRAHTSGSTVVDFQLHSMDGRKYGEPVPLTIVATGPTAIAVVIIGGALAVMVLAVITRVLRRRQPVTDETPDEEPALEVEEVKS